MTYTTTFTYDDEDYVFETDYDYGELYDICEIGYQDIFDELRIPGEFDNDVYCSVHSVLN